MWTLHRHKRLFNGFLAFMLSLLLVFLPPVISYKEAKKAEAVFFIPALVAAVDAAAPIIAAALFATGVAVTGMLIDEAIDLFKQDVSQQADTQLQSELEQAKTQYDTAPTVSVPYNSGASYFDARPVPLPDYTATKVRDWARERFPASSSPSTTTTVTQNIHTPITLPAEGSTSTLPDGSQVSITFTDNLGNAMEHRIEGGYITRYKNGAQDGSLGAGSPIIIYRHTAAETGMGYPSVRLKAGTNSFYNYYQPGTIAGTTFTTKSITYSTAPALNDPNYDYAQNGSRSVAAPTTLADLGNLTADEHTNVQNPTYSPPVTLVSQTTNPDGTITKIYSDGKTVTTYPDGRTVTQNADGTTSTTTPTTTASTVTVAGPVTIALPTSTGSLNWNPLLVAGTTFTEKFPFSLPWDLARSVGSVVATPKTPEFVFEFSVVGHPYRVDIPWNLWADLIPVARSLELIVFDIGLILGAARLLKAD